MNNVLLGKTIKSMYKLSGKTLTQLSDETGLTVDTINNLFYARIQKPGLDGVNTLVNAMGFSLQQLLTFLDEHPDADENCDITELFTQAVSAPDTFTAAEPTKATVKTTGRSVFSEIELINAEHEKQLDRFRATHLRYVEQLQQQHANQIEQMKAHNRQMEQHFDHSVDELRSLHAQEIDRLERQSHHAKRTTRILMVFTAIETGLILLLLILDMINKSIGWMR